MKILIFWLFSRHFSTFLLLITISSTEFTISINCNIKVNFFYPSICEASIAPVFYPETSIKSVYNVSYKKPLNADVSSLIEVFKVENSTIFFIPRGLKNFLPNLLKISLKNVNLKEIRQIDLAPFDMLQSLQLPYNDLTYLEKDLFAFNPELIAVNLDFNNIKSIHPETFKSFNLQSLSMKGSQCIEGDFKGFIDQSLLKKKCQPDASSFSSTFYELLLIIGIALAISITFLLLFWISVDRKLRSVTTRLDSAGKFFSGRIKIEKTHMEPNSYKEEQENIYEDIVYFQSMHGEEVIQVKGKEYLRISELNTNKFRTKNTVKGES